MAPHTAKHSARSRVHQTPHRVALEILPEEVMMNGFWTRGLRVALIALVALLLTWGAVALDWAAFTGQKADGDTGANPGDDVSLTDTMKKNLTVSPEDLLPGQAKCTSGDRFNRNSLVQGKWSDSVSTPYKASAKDGMLKETFDENCTNPTLLDMNVQALSRITIDGWNVGDHNPWMAQFLNKASDPGLRAAFLTKKENVNGIYVTADFQRAAAMTNTLLTRFMNVGVVTEPSTTNWHKPGGGLVAGELVRTVLNDKQENLPVLRLELTEKGQGCVYAIGFNTGDKRFETLGCKAPPSKTPHTPTTGCKKDCGPTQGCTHNCNPPTCHTNCNPCTHNCTPPPKCPPGQHGTWPICKDGPENQPPGNNPDGNQPGGHNDTDGPGIPNPEPTFPNTPYTPPPAPQPTQTPRPDPVEPPATGAPHPTEAPTTCVPAPGHTSC